MQPLRNHKNQAIKTWLLVQVWRHHQRSTKKLLLLMRPITPLCSRGMYCVDLESTRRKILGTTYPNPTLIPGGGRMVPEHVYRRNQTGRGY
jgi:hypothetical protein